MTQENQVLFVKAFLKLWDDTSTQWDKVNENLVTIYNLFLDNENLPKLSADELLDELLAKTKPKYMKVAVWDNSWKTIEGVKRIIVIFDTYASVYFARLFFEDKQPMNVELENLHQINS